MIPQSADLHSHPYSRPEEWAVGASGVSDGGERQVHEQESVLCLHKVVHSREHQVPQRREHQVPQRLVIHLRQGLGKA